MTKMAVANARLKTGLDPLVIRASCNHGKLIDFAEMPLCQSVQGLPIKACRAPSTVLLLALENGLAYWVCDLCAAEFLRCGEPFLVLAQAPLDRGAAS